MLKYKVKGRNDITDVKGCIFENRGITDVYGYTHLNDDCLISYNKLSNINDAVEKFLYCMENNYNVYIIQDSDTDGVTSAAILYSYIRRAFPGINLKYLIHTGKQHGLSDDVTEYIKATNETLILLPDAGTNDVDICKSLSELGAEIIVLDHHEREIDNKGKEIDNRYAIVVNNKTSPDYPNKEFCGAGIVYKFLQAVDDEIWETYADDYLDLVMLGNISDIMDIRSFETKYIIEKGLSQIKNKCLKAFIKAQEYSIKDNLNINAITFYVTPLINAMCRVGNMDEKDLLFRAFVETDEEFDYKKRDADGSYKIVKETIYERAVRLCKNAKSRQDNAVKKALPDLHNFVTDHNCEQNTVMFIKADNKFQSTFTGLAAIKIADYYKHPCLVLRKTDDDACRGSARNFDNCPIENLKDILENTGQFEFCRGHQGAFGFQIKRDNINNAMSILDEQLSKIDFSVRTVDFEIDYEDLVIAFIQSIEELKDYYGTGIKRPYVVIKNIPIRSIDGIVMGKSEDNWKVISETNIAFVKFKVPDDDIILKHIKNKSDNVIHINIIGSVGFNEYEGIITPQTIIDDYEVI